MSRSFPGSTIGAALDVHRGEGPGFALMRVSLALAILFDHARMFAGSPVVSGHSGDAVFVHATTSWSGPSRPIYIALVPAFFALSGFLVTGSAIRVRYTSTFLAFRALRILPALIVEVTLSALILGPIFTRLPLRDYFTDTGFFRYFGNVIGWITFDLPGVFQSNPYPTVNGNLWTLPSEFDCYFITAIIMSIGLIYRRLLLTYFFVIITIVLIALNIFTGLGVTPFQYAGYTVTYYFFMGMLFFHWKDYIPVRWWLFAISSLASYILLFFSRTIYIAPIFVVYCIVFLGVVGIPEIKWLRDRDYSYGLYLYGCPITQAIVALTPGLRGHGILTFLIAFVSSMAFAAFSWNVIEKPTLALKSQLPRRFFPRRLGRRAQRQSWRPKG